MPSSPILSYARLLKRKRFCLSIVPRKLAYPRLSCTSPKKRTIMFERLF